jgi:uncharacterized lipoprotein YddW (UPF0748 family)
MINFLSSIFVALLIILQSAYSADLPDSGSVRGIWVVRHWLTTPGKIDSVLKLTRDCGFTDLFVQVRGRGDAYYKSQHESRAREIKDPDFDPLEYILRENIADRIRIHAWLNVFYVWSKDTLPADSNHIVQKKSNWLARSIHWPEFISNYPQSFKEANLEGLYVSPLQQEAQEHFIQVVKDIISRYPVSGIHLDYIRYPDQSFDIHPDVVKGFKNRYVLDPQQFLANPEIFAQKFSISGYEVFYYHWRQYLMDGLSDFVKRISKTVHSQNEQIFLSAAVKPDIVEAHWNYFQDWDRWIKESWLDFAVPMNYASDTRIFRRRIDQYLDKMDSDRYVVGISLYNQNEEQVIRKIAQVMTLDQPGFVLFSFDQLVKMPRLQRYLKKLAGD